MKRFLASLGLLTVIPFLIERRSRVVRKTWIAMHPAGIFPFIDDLRNWPLWVASSRCGKVVRDYEGPAGAGAVQHWATACAEGTIKIIASLPDNRVSYMLESDSSRRQVEGVISLKADGAGTQVTWACWWLGAPNVYMRYIDLALRFWTCRDLCLGLRNLKKLAESNHQKEEL